MTQMATLYRPPDLETAYQEWGANCGPSALAAIVGSPLFAVRSYFPDFAKRRYVNPTHMQAAIGRTGRRGILTPRLDAGRGRAAPRHGVAFLQFSSKKIDAMPIGVQYRYTHWVAVEGERRCRMVYDCNHDGWMPWGDWWAEYMPLFYEENDADSVWCRTAYEVQLPRK
jgi:hypothetical protein